MSTKTRIKVSIRYRHPDIKEALLPYSEVVSGTHAFWSSVPELTPLEFDTLARSTKKHGLCSPIMVDSDGLIVWGLDHLLALHVLGRTIPNDQIVQASLPPEVAEKVARQFRLDQKMRISAKVRSAQSRDPVAEPKDESSSDSSLIGGSFFDTPEGRAYEEKCQREMLFRQATTPTTEQLRRLLKFGKRRGHLYQPGFDPYPSLKQCSEYCGIDMSTMSRIVSGKQDSMKTHVMDILFAITGVFPAFPLERSLEERKARMADADRCVEEGCSPDEVREAIFAGMRSRCSNAESFEGAA